MHSVLDESHTKEDAGLLTKKSDGRFSDDRIVIRYENVLARDERLSGLDG
ncbi:MAG TPA: hypothetical protein VK763_03310 [Terriglobales bacterium]|jgi:hypothetical protein|nr:hypothetical protein [Terriglobales bacterium]